MTHQVLSDLVWTTVYQGQIMTATIGVWCPFPVCAKYHPFLVNQRWIHWLAYGTCPNYYCNCRTKCGRADFSVVFSLFHYLSTVYLHGLNRTVEEPFISSLNSVLFTSSAVLLSLCRVNFVLTSPVWRLQGECNH